MIVSHKYKFIFVAIPKTGTHSLRNFVRPFLGKLDWEQCTLYDKKSFPVKKLSDIGHGHITMNQLKSHVPKEIWQDYFSFAIVRHPYDRFLSYCYFINRFNNRMSNSPEKCVWELLNDPKLFGDNPWLIPQSRYTHNGHDQIVNFIGRFESIDKEIRHVMNKLHIAHDNRELEKVNVIAKTKEYILSNKEKQKLDHYYLEDFNNFYTKKD